MAYQKTVPITDSLAKAYNTDIIRFLEDQYILPETGKTIVLEGWQKELILRPLFYDLKPDGTRKYTLALVGMPKKNGKSSLAAGIGLWFLFAGEPSGEIIIAANNLDQASLIIYNKIRGAFMANPQLKSSARLYKRSIEMRGTGTVCRPIAHKYESAAGVNPTLVIFDELWGFDSREFYDELTESPARREPLSLVVTYAGYDEDSLLHELYDAGRKKTDPSMFFVWLNENLASWVKPEYLARQKKRMPPNVYARFHENRWAPKEAAFVTEEDIAQMHSTPWTLQLGPVQGGQVFDYVVASDLGLSNDRTVRAIGHFDKLADKVFVDNIRVWVGTPQKHVDIANVEADLVDSCGRFRTVKLVVDPWQMEYVMQRLKGKLTVIPFNFQTDMLYLSQLLITLLRNGKLVCYGIPEFDKELKRLVSKQTAKGWKIEHLKKQHNDITVAVGMMAMEAIRGTYGKLVLPGDDEFAQRPLGFDNIRDREF